MRTIEILKDAKYGVEKKIQEKCEVIADTWTSPGNIAELEELLQHYHEIEESLKFEHWIERISNGIL